MKLKQKHLDEISQKINQDRKEVLINKFADKVLKLLAIPSNLTVKKHKYSIVVEGEHINKATMEMLVMSSSFDKLKTKFIINNKREKLIIY